MKSAVLVPAAEEDGSVPKNGLQLIGFALRLG
jgi:hypothetical protein